MPTIEQIRAQMPIVLPNINVVSVLPADTTGVQPKPAKDVLGPDRLWWPWILLAALILVALALAYWWWRRRRARPEMREFDFLLLFSVMMNSNPRRGPWKLAWMKGSLTSRSAVRRRAESTRLDEHARFELLRHQRVDCVEQRFRRHLFRFRAFYDCHEPHTGSPVTCDLLPALNCATNSRV